MRERLAEAPSFVAFEGYDTIAVLADVLRAAGADRARTAGSWPSVAVEGTRGRIRFSRRPGISVWQWAWAPVQVVDRDPAEPDRFRILHGLPAWRGILRPRDLGQIRVGKPVRARPELAPPGGPPGGGE